MKKLTCLLLLISLFVGCAKKIKPRVLTNQDCMNCTMQLIRQNDSLRILLKSLKKVE